MKIDEKLKEAVNETVVVLLKLKSVVRGYESPCSLCIGCQIEDGRKGICESFILKEKL